MRPFAGNAYSEPSLHAGVLEIQASIDTDEALSYLGYRGQSLDHLLSEMLDSVKTEVERLPIKALVRYLPIIGDNRIDSIRFKDCSLKPTGNDISKHLKGAIGAYVMVATLGFDSERLIKREFAVSNTRGLLTDACASAYVEAGANALSDMVSRDASARSLVTNSRFSPGYGDLGLDVQEPLLDALNAKRLLGISITDTGLLIPMKTITAIIGAFPEPSIPNDAARRCDACAIGDGCMIRRQGRTCNGPQ